MPDAEVTWPQLVALMAFGDGPDPAMRGIVRAREVRRVDEVDEEEPADVEIPGHGRYRLSENRVRVARRGRLVRREHMDGRLLAIQGADTQWIWLDDDEAPTAFPRPGAAWGWPDSPLTQRRAMDTWNDDDFTRPLSAPAPTEFLGRAAWQVELRPPPHKSFPVTLVVDAATGLLLSQRNEGFGSFAEWEELELGVDLPDDLFEWHGPSRRPPDHRAEHEAELARRAEWLRRNGIGPLSVTVPVELMLHEEDDGGGFHLSLRAGLDGSLLRRPHSDAPWDELMNWPHLHRWTDAGWDWWLGTDEPLSEELLATIKAQLRGAS